MEGTHGSPMKALKCDICDKTFSMKGDLKTHMSEAHMAFVQNVLELFLPTKPTLATTYRILKVMEGSVSANVVADGPTTVSLSGHSDNTGIHLAGDADMKNIDQNDSTASGHDIFDSADATGSCRQECAGFRNKNPKSGFNNSSTDEHNVCSWIDIGEGYATDTDTGSVLGNLDPETELNGVSDKTQNSDNSNAIADSPNLDLEMDNTCNLDKETNDVIAEHPVTAICSRIHRGASRCLTPSDRKSQMMRDDTLTNGAHLGGHMFSTHIKTLPLENRMTTRSKRKRNESVEQKSVIENFTESVSVINGVDKPVPHYETMAKINMITEAERSESECLVLRHQCNICLKRFYRKSECVRHLRVHSGDRPFECEICLKKFANKGHLNKHMESVHNVRRNSDQVNNSSHEGNEGDRGDGQTKEHPMGSVRKLPGGNVPNLQNQNERVNSQIPRDLRSRKTGHTISTKRLRKAVTEAQKRHPCNVCSKKFYRPSERDRHLRIHSERPFACEICQMTFTQKGGLDNHIAHLHKHPRNVVHTIQGSYPDVPTTETTDDSMFVDSDARDSISENKFISNENDEAKLLSQYRSDSANESELCKTTFSREAVGLTISGTGKGGDSTETKQKHTCSICFKNFNVRSKLDRHLCVHSNARPFTCNFCDRKYSRKDSRDVHMANAHDITKKNCPCREKLQTMNHRLSKGCSESLVEIFEDRGDGQTNEHHMGPDSTLPCGNVPNQQDQDRRGVESQITHNLRSSKTGQTSGSKRLHKVVTGAHKPHRCYFCSKTFHRPSIRDRHMRVHIRERPLACEICQITFTQKAGLDNHILNSHKLPRDVVNTKQGPCPDVLSTETTDDSIDVDSETADSISENKLICNENDETNRLPPDKSDSADESELCEEADGLTISGTDRGGDSTETKKQHTCSICFKNFDVRSKLDRHLRVHSNERPFTCSLCDRKYARKESRDVHMANAHDISKKNCLDRENSQTTNDRLANSSSEDLVELLGTHLARNGRPLARPRPTEEQKRHKCDICPWKFYRPVELKRHIKTHTGVKPFACQACDRQFVQKRSLDSHYLKIHNNSADGEQQSGFSNMGDYSKASGKAPVHYNKLSEATKPGGNLGQSSSEDFEYGYSYIGERVESSPAAESSKETEIGASSSASTVDTERTTYMSIICDTGIAGNANCDNTSIPDHELQNKVIAVSGDCNDALKLDENARPASPDEESARQIGKLTHSKHLTNNKGYPCKMCPSSYKCKGEFNRHMKSHSEVKPWKCNFCGKDFTERGKVRAHIRIAHMDERNNVCHMCGKSFKQRSTLLSHMLIHSDEKPFKCDLCEKAFKSNTQLKVHKLSHTEVYVCDVCGKKFDQKYCWQKHAAVHSESRPYACDKCNKTFKNANAARRHVWAFHEGKKPYSCIVCGREFAEKHHMREHTTQHYGIGPKNCNNCKNKQNDDNCQCVCHKSKSDIIRFTCEICGRTFLTKNKFTVHLSRHNNVRSHKCDNCEKAFFLESELEFHRRLVHLGEKKYICKVCGKAFGCSAYLREHEPIHTGHKPFECVVCGWRFYRRSALKTHKMTHTDQKLYNCDMCDTGYSRKKYLIRHTSTAHGQGAVLPTKSIDS